MPLRPAATIVTDMTTPRIGPHGDAGDPIFGRERELARLYELVDGVHERGEVLLVGGEAGIGKSTLLAAATRHAETRGMQVLRTSGVHSEAALPFAGLHRLVLPVLDTIEHLPSPQRTALMSALGMAEAPTPDRFLIALAVLELLSDAAELTSMLIVVDDAQWLDRSSGDVLAFVARRIEHEPIVMLVASRDGGENYFDGAGLPELRLWGLDGTAAGALLAARAPDLTPAVRERMLEVAEGNLLALVELPVSLGTQEVVGHSPLPLTERLEWAFASRVAGLPPSTQTLLLLAAADDDGLPGEILAAAAKIDGTGFTAEDFAPAIDAELVRIDHAQISFRHPLMRSAVYQRATLVERRAAHAAWATVLTDHPDRQTWHSAGAIVGPDERVAAELEAAAKRARRRGAIDVAIGALERAAELSEGRGHRAQLLLDAAEVASELGRRELVLGFVEEAEQVGLGGVDRQRAVLIQEAFDTGEDAVGIEQVIEVTEGIWQRDSDSALNVLRRAAGKSWWVGRSEERRMLLVAAVQRMGVPEEDPQRLAILALSGSTKYAADVLGRLSRVSFDGASDPIAARLLGLAGYAVGEFEFAVDALTVAIDRLRAQGRIAPLAQAVVARAASALQMGRLDLAIADAEEGRRLSMETAQPLFAEYARAGQALLAGLRGDEGEAEAIAAEVERTMLPMCGKAVLWDVQLARGTKALCAGQYPEAFDQLVRTFDPNDPAEHYRKKFWAIGDLAEAALHSGRQEEARPVLDQAETVSDAMPSPKLRVALEYARPLLAGDAAEALFEAALDTDLTRWPLHRARLQLAYGVWLRRRKRIGESRAPLAAAKSAFDALGTGPGRSGRAKNCAAPASPVAPANAARWTSLPPRNCRSPAWSPQGSPTAR